jgi:UDP-2,3-diacylglucosamine hydrolase
VDLISDLHLSPGDTATFEAWRTYLSRTRADAVFILGDLFEVWVGDDSVDAPDEVGRFEQSCADALALTARRVPVHFMPGNRDFLLGADFIARAGLVLLEDPTVLQLGQRRWLLSHGDALCLDDFDYQRFRAQVRTPAWRDAFLARPLPERRALARGLRTESEARKQAGATYADADAALSQQWLALADADALVHGHTHRPRDHALPGGQRRHVLSDWDLLASPPRAEVVRLARDGTFARMPPGEA